MMSRLAMIATAAVTCLATTLAGCAGDRSAAPAATQKVSPLSEARQLVLVVAPTWDSPTATLQCYSRPQASGAWVAEGESVKVSIGRTGLAWGRGLHGQSAPNNSPAGPTKREGDGKAPAGTFALPYAFGYAPVAAVGQPSKAVQSAACLDRFGNLSYGTPAVKLPYVALTGEHAGVDDVKSKYYNQVVRADGSLTKDWDSAETMLRPDGLYEWGVFVGHNTDPIQAGAGSCIFLHIWRGPDKPTAGCTAMSKDDMIRLAAWLDPAKKPVLVQLPAAARDQLAAPWGLPAK